MAVNDKGIILSGFYSLPGGMDSGIDPSLLEKDRASFAVNCRFRGGFITHRPPFSKIPMNFGGNTILETRVTTGNFQVAGYYLPDNGAECILASIGGRVFRFNVATDNSVQELTITQSTLSTVGFTIPAVGVTDTAFLTSTAGISINTTILFGGVNYTVAGISSPISLLLSNIDGVPGTVVALGTPLFFYDLNPATTDRAWCKQAENYWILQNNQNLPLIYDGATLRRGVPNPPNLTDAPEVPIGNVMEYAMQRLCVTLPDTRTFAVGDLAYSSSGLLPDGRDAVLKFSQNVFQASGKNFTVPMNCGGIQSMTAIPVLDGSLNQGPLLVGTPEICFTIQLPPDALTWAAVTTPIQSIAMVHNGPVSDRGAILVNSDVWFRRFDGWGSFITARRDFNTWANTPVSAELSRILDSDDISLLQYENGVFFGGRIIKTTSPARSPFGVYHRGLIALDMDRIGGLRPHLPPAYDGLWTGLNTLQLVAGTFNKLERCFAFSVNFAGTIELYEILKEGEFDDMGQGENVRITWPFETAVVGQSKAVGGGPFDLKRLENGEIWIDNLFGEGTIKVWFRPLGAVCWTLWREDLQVCATTNTCTDLPTGDCQDTTVYRAQYRSRIGFGKPPDDCDRNEDRPAYVAEGWQLRIECKGHFRVRGLKIYSRPLAEPVSEPMCSGAIALSSPADYFFNVSTSYTVSCPAGYTGMPVTITIPANRYAAGTQAAANALALEDATSQANAALVCHPT
jgi:hypothetical protein